MSGRTKITLLNALLNLMVHSVLCVFLIPRYGVLGAAFARLASVILLRTARLIQVYVIWKMYPFRADFFKPLMAGALSWLGLMLMKNTLADIFSSLLALLSGIFLFLGIYSAAVLSMGMPQEDKKVLECNKNKKIWESSLPLVGQISTKKRRKSHEGKRRKDWHQAESKDRMEKWDFTLTPPALNETHSPLGIFISAGRGFRKDKHLEEVQIVDLTPTLLHLFGIPVPEGMDGRVLKELFL